MMIDGAAKLDAISPNLAEALGYNKPLMIGPARRVDRAANANVRPISLHYTVLSERCFFSQRHPTILQHPQKYTRPPNIFAKRSSAIDRPFLYRQHNGRSDLTP